MTTFTIERSVQSPELQEAIVSLQGMVDFEVPLLEPKVVLFTKRMCQRAIHVEEQSEAHDVMLTGFKQLATHESPAVATHLGYLTVLGGGRTGNEKCLGFPLTKGSRSRRNPKDLLIAERKNFAEYFGIPLHATETKPNDIITSLFPVRGVKNAVLKDAISAWQNIRGEKSFYVEFSDAKLVEDKN